MTAATIFADSRQLLPTLLESLRGLDAQWTEVANQAESWINVMRQSSLSVMETLLHEYPLAQKEGVLLLRLAEALPRIPDAVNAHRLLLEILSSGEWEKHAGSRHSLLAKLSEFALILADKSSRHAVGAAIAQRMMRKMLHHMSREFILGESTPQAINRAQPWRHQGYVFSFDILGEAARTAAQADAYFEAYRHALNLIPEGDSMSIKLSGLHPRFTALHKERLFVELLPRLKTLALAAKARRIALSFDAEEANRLDIGLELFSALFRDPKLADYEGLGYVLQAYQKRSFAVIDRITTLARETGKPLNVRLVKGAYWDYEIKHAQVQGLTGYPVFTRKSHTDVSYLACAKKLLETKELYPQFATHNAVTVAAILTLAKAHPEARFEFQRLHGMGAALYDQLIADYPCRIYAPIGQHQELLPYLIRRLLENGANSSFLHALRDAATPVTDLLANPMRAAQARPQEAITPPAQLFGEARKNSQGIDLGYPSLHPTPSLPLIPALETAPEQAMKTAEKGFSAWNHLPIEERAHCLEQAAERIEQAREDFYGLLLSKAGKTLQDAVDEVREAADFCRYYAAQARRLFTPRLLPSPTGEENMLKISGRGVFVAISPWNFPLAIFTGQIAAALVCGNSVVAKPAPQTPKIAAFAVSLLHQSGVPPEALQLVQGNGAIGAALVANPATAGVVFTGGTETAKAIERSLAAKEGAITPLIAETGGQNCMIIDSTALVEQAVDHVIHSAFGSAGQRCSALRVAYVQEEIAENFITVLAGAMQELRLGDGHHLSSDIGRIIDRPAYDKLSQHVARMKQEAKLIAKTPCALEAPYFAPHAFEIQSIHQLHREVFGPILHIIRYASGNLKQVVDDINSTGYGLTFGIHSRLHRTIDEVCERIRAGNIYVNRSMTGAVVGVQPFGGEGLSGTGFKAGGEHYLLRFITERTRSTNLTALGGNVALLS